MSSLEFPEFHEYSPECLGIHPDQSALSPNGQLFAFPTVDGTVKVVRVRSGEVTQSLRAPDRKQCFIKVSFLQNGRYLLARNHEIVGVGYLWHVFRGQFVMKLPFEGPFAFAGDDSNHLATFYHHGENEGQIALWNLDRREKVLQFPAVLGVQFVNFGYPHSFSSDGSLFSVADSQGVRVWRTWSGKKVVSMKLNLKPGQEVSQVELSPDGRFLAVVIPGVRLELWELSQGK
jgi:WD40 repeat protein